jgi:hypothetical protein
MKTLRALAALLIVAVPARASFTPQMTAATGSVPAGINYQGRLEQSGVPVNTSVTMIFKVMDAASGGNTLWSSGNQTVAISAGLFNTVVPMPVDPLIGGGSRWMEVVVNGTALVPREPLNAVPYALVAKTVEGTIDISSSNFNLSSTGNSSILFVSSLTARVGVGTTSPAERLHVSSGNAFVQYGVWTSTVALIPQTAAPAAGRTGMLYYNGTQDRLNVYAAGPNAFVNVATGTAVQQTGDTMWGTLNVTTPADTLSIVASSNVVLNGGMIVASSAAFTVTGDNNFAITSSSGIKAGGPVIAPFFVGTLNGTANGSVNKTGDTMTGTLVITPPALTNAIQASSNVVVNGANTAVNAPYFQASSGFVGDGTRLTGVVLKAGDTMTGTLTVNSPAITASVQTSSNVVLNGANTSVNAPYFQASGGFVGSGTRLSGVVLEAGDTMTGTLVLNPAALTNAVQASSNVVVNGANTGLVAPFVSGTRIVGGDAAITGAVAIGLTAGAAADKLEVAGGSVRLTEAAGVAGSVKLFSKVTTNAGHDCNGNSSGCGTGTAGICLAAWTSAGATSACGTLGLGQRCLCAGFGN